MVYVKVTSKRQMTFPKEILDKMNVKKGDLLEASLNNNILELKSIRKTILDLKGSVKVKGVQDFKSIREKVLEEVAEEAAFEGKNS